MFVINFKQSVFNGNSLANFQMRIERMTATRLRQLKNYSEDFDLMG
jgi:hypothetical protein